MKDAKFIYNARLLDENIDENGAIFVSDGKIHSVIKTDFLSQKEASAVAESFLHSGKNAELIDAQGLTLTPAFIDTHVHLRDPGQTQKEDLASGLMAAAHGGYGTVVAMPNTNPVISEHSQAEKIMERGESLGLTHIFQSVSITAGFDGKTTHHLDGLDRSRIPLITEDGHDVESAAIMLEGMKKAAENRQIVSCHSEDCSLSAMAKHHREIALELMRKYGVSACGKFTSSNVPEEVIKKINGELMKANGILCLAEDLATERNIQLAKKAGCHIHICHISTKKSIESVRNAKTSILETNTLSKNIGTWDSFSVTAEATPHHIALTGDCEPWSRTLVNPPLRSEEDRLSVIQALKDGTIDCIATDHAPHTLEDKAMGAPGFTGLEVAYGVCNKFLVNDGHISPRKLSSLMSANPARLLGLKKGLLNAGYEADLALVAPLEEWSVDSSKFFSKGKATPFDGMKLCGKVHSLFLSGRKFF